jgi:hypothetical protein
LVFEKTTELSLALIGSFSLRMSRLILASSGEAESAISSSERMERSILSFNPGNTSRTSALPEMDGSSGRSFPRKFLQS